MKLSLEISLSNCLRVSREEIKSIQEKKDDAGRMPKEETEKDKPETPGDLGKVKLSKDSTPQIAAIESSRERRSYANDRKTPRKPILPPLKKPKRKCSANNDLRLP
jgi:hypothetical protein